MKPSRIPSSLSAAEQAAATSTPAWKRRQKALRSLSMIVSRQNQKIKDIRHLLRCKADRAVLEGPHLVQEAIAGAVRLEFVLATPDFLATPAGGKLEESVGAALHAVDPRLLDELTDADSPRGVLAVAMLPQTGLDAVPVDVGGVYLFLDGIQDPGNFGALIRTAEALGATAVVAAPGCVHANHPRALRASAGSLLRARPATDVMAADLRHHLRSASPNFVALTVRGGTPLEEAALAGTQVFAVGAEGPGLSPDLLRQVDHRVTIPLASPVESLNAAVAAALVLYECRRRARH